MVDSGEGTKFAICVNNAGYSAPLTLHNIYCVLPDKDAEIDGDFRVVDESGEDYLYSAERFISIELPRAVEKSL